MTTTCPSCSWPLDELTTSAHRTSEGVVDYRHCICGTWLVLLNGHTLATRGHQPTPSTPDTPGPAHAGENLETAER